MTDATATRNRSMALTPSRADPVAKKRWLLQDTEVERWGLGIEQEVESQGLLLYAQFHHYEGSFVGQRCTDNVGPGCGPLDPAKKESFTAAPWQAFVLGARIQF